ncbi:ABC transporter permease [Knoellia sp. CPCC 206450]|uniref:ABC transporter permease n=1 Tax=Knoellia tibetensis TaxID=3404798 RepID=UPI003B4306D8
MRELLRFLGSELRLVASRRRNQAGVLVLMALPIAIVVGNKVSGQADGGGGTGAGFVDQITSNGIFAAFAALTIELGLFLPLGIAMVSGDAVAGEAQAGTLRYLLTVPVGRTRMLVVKYLALVVTGIFGAVVVATTGVVFGALFFGAGPLTTLSGSQIPLSDGVWRLALSVLYVSAGLAALAAVGLFVSTLTEQPIAVTVVVMVFTAASWILDSIPQVEAIHPWLLVDRWLSFADLMREPPEWGTVVSGLGVDAVYAGVFLLGAWAAFTNRDVTS